MNFHTLLRSLCQTMGACMLVGMLVFGQSLCAPSNAFAAGPSSIGDPQKVGCAGQTAALTTSKPISTTANAVLITGATGKSTYICAINIASAVANSVSIVEGTTGGTCGSATAAVFGAVTAANGWPLGATGGLTQGNGQGIIAKTASQGTDVCIFVSGATLVAGNIIWAQY